jgi:hypothetical protein
VAAAGAEHPGGVASCTKELPAVGEDRSFAGTSTEIFQMEDQENRKILLTRMDDAFNIYSAEAEKLSVLLAERRDALSWSLYHNLLKQRTAETVAYEKYRSIKDQLFGLINPPAAPDRPESSVN